MNEAEAKSAGVIAPPPLLYAGPLVAGLALNRLVPLRFLSPPVTRLAGWPLTTAGAGLMALFVRSFLRAGTPIDPRQPVARLVVTGPYRFSRNPSYLGMTLLYAGIASAANSGWSLAALPAVLAVMRRGVIDREERYLQGRFGDEYLRFCDRVPRWL